MTCSDCIHYNVCKFHGMNVDDETLKKEFCGEFQDKEKFVKLPCKVGDTVYGVVNDRNSENPHIITARVKGIDIGWYGLVVDTYPSEEDNVPMSFGELGKWVFATKEEAEADLEERKKLLESEKDDDVVNCKNCKFRYTDTCFAKHETGDDDYCSNGARKIGGKKNEQM